MVREIVIFGMGLAVGAVVMKYAADTEAGTEVVLDIFEERVGCRIKIQDLGSKISTVYERSAGAAGFTQTVYYTGRAGDNVVEPWDENDELLTPDMMASILVSTKEKGSIIQITINDPDLGASDSSNVIDIDAVSEVSITQEQEEGSDHSDSEVGVVGNSGSGELVYNDPSLAAEDEEPSDTENADE